MASAWWSGDLPHLPAAALKRFTVNAVLTFSQGTFPLPCSLLSNCLMTYLSFYLCYCYLSISFFSKLFHVNTLLLPLSTPWWVVFILVYLNCKFKGHLYRELSIMVPLLWPPTSRCRVYLSDCLEHQTLLGGTQTFVHQRCCEEPNSGSPHFSSEQLGDVSISNWIPVPSNNQPSKCQTALLIGSSVNWERFEADLVVENDSPWSRLSNISTRPPLFVARR